ncbi:MAG: multicopper oxidase family protein [Acidimicrobiales bacterium]
MPESEDRAAGGGPAGAERETPPETPGTPRRPRTPKDRLRRALGGGRGFVLAVAVVAVVAVIAGTVVGRDGPGDEPGGEAATATREGSAPTEGGDQHGGAAPADGQADQPEVPAQVDMESVPVRAERRVRAEPEVRAGVKVFTLTAEPVQWEFIPGKSVTAWGYNGQVPGPEVWVDEGDQVRIELTNRLPVPTTIHWHGVAVPNEMDGVPGVTQDPIEPGESFTYEFRAEPSGTFWYHSHFDSARQLDMGLAGAFVVKGRDEPAYDRDFVQLVDEWIRLQDGRNGWEGVDHAGHNPGEYNWFTINGKSFPATDNMVVREGDRVRVRVVNAGFQAHPMHLHGKRFTVVAKDGAPLPAPYQADTVLVGAGERYDFEFVADDPGSWMFHCHILHHVGNDAVEPGGLMNFVTYEGYQNAYQREEGKGTT